MRRENLKNVLLRLKGLRALKLVITVVPLKIKQKHDILRGAGLTFLGEYRLWVVFLSHSYLFFCLFTYCGTNKSLKRGICVTDFDRKFIMCSVAHWGP